ncbi:2111_t:CDS:2, partial [Dentiscutata heterogama]
YDFKPSLQEVKDLVTEKRGNTIPIYCRIPADLLTPVGAYLRITEQSKFSFLFESVTGGEKIGRYSFVGADPYKVLKVEDNEGDPLNFLEEELKSVNYIPVPGLPLFTGGAVGYIAYDCIKYFEPRTARELDDQL